MTARVVTALSVTSPVRTQLGRVAQVHMFQLTLRLGGVEVEQHADAARYAVGDRDLRGAEQWHVAPAQQARGPRGILGGEVRGRRGERRLELLRLGAGPHLERGA